MDTQKLHEAFEQIKAQSDQRRDMVRERIQTEIDLMALFFAYRAARDNATRHKIMTQTLRRMAPVFDAAFGLAGGPITLQGLRGSRTAGSAEVPNA